jgi:hypothetical protein
MAVLTATGITFSDATSLSSRYGVLPQSTVAVFFQAAAPTGWTQSATHNDKALRVVSGTGGGFGSGGTSGVGGNTFTSAFPAVAKPISVPISVTSPVDSFTLGNTTLASGQIPNHTHSSLQGLSGGAGANPFSNAGTFRVAGNTATSGINELSGGAHGHPFSGSASVITTASTTMDLRVQYVDAIICTLS